MDYVLDYMKRKKIPLTIDDYCRYNYGKGWKQIQAYPEWVEEVLDLVEKGDLSVPQKLSRRVH